MSSSSAGADPASAAAGSPFAPGGGEFGGAGASADLPSTPEGSPRDDPYFYGSTQDRAAYYDADDFQAFDAAAAPDATETDAPETDTGAS